MDRAPTTCPDASQPSWGAATHRALTRRCALELGTITPLLATACSGLGSSNGPPSPTFAGTVTVNAWFPPPGPDPATFGHYGIYLQDQIGQFQQANPKVKVTIDPYTTAPGTSERLQAAVVAGDPPDIWQANNIPMYSYAAQNALEPIDAYLDKRGKADFYEWARDNSTVESKMYEWPWMLAPTGVMINRSMYEEKNLTNLLPKPGPTADWTFDQWKAALKAVTKITGDPEQDVYGTAFFAGATGGDYWQMMHLWGYGAELYDRDQRKVTICSPEGVAGLQMLVDLITKDRVAVPGAESLDSPKVRELFYKKRLGIMNNASPDNVGEVERRLKDQSILPPFNVQFAPPPHAPGKKAAALLTMQSFLVFRRTKDADRTRAAMLLGYHLTDNAAQKVITAIGQLPVRKSVGNIYPNDLNRSTAYAVIENGRDLGRFPENGEIRVLWQKAAQSAFTLQKSPKDALDEMCRLSEPIMAKRSGR